MFAGDFCIQLVLNRIVRNEGRGLADKTTGADTLVQTERMETKGTNTTKRVQTVRERRGGGNRPALWEEVN